MQTGASPPAAWSILVHGGAGQIDDRQRAAHQAGCAKAAEIGRQILAEGGTAVDAAVEAVVSLELDPVFNAGIGATLDRAGMITCDAAVMRGGDLAYGAVASVAGVPHPVRLARAIMLESDFSLLCGPGALEFARAHGVELTDPMRLLTDPSRSRWWFTKAEAPPAREARPPPTGDTVGAVARDRSGEVASATSTGGLLNKHPGRIGDSPIAGAGTYARADLGAVGATGHGETLLKTVTGFQALLDLRVAEDLEATLLATIEGATHRAGGRGGLIAVLPDGRLAWARNTKHMGVAWAFAGQGVRSAF